MGLLSELCTFVSQGLCLMELVLKQIPKMADCCMGRYLVREALYHLYCPNPIIHIHLFFAV